MKKLVCIFLIAWLPLFVSEASAASLQMLFTNLNDDSHSNVTDMPHCHQHITNAHQSTSHVNEAPSKQHHTCTVCGFCVIASCFANITHAPSLITSGEHSKQPTFFAHVFHSQTYPPAIRPPIPFKKHSLNPSIFWTLRF